MNETERMSRSNAGDGGRFGVHGSVVSAGDSPSPTTQAAQLECLGANACEGQSACKTATRRTPGQELVQGRRLRQ